MIRLLEELSINAWPSLDTMVYDGWLLRFANGYSRRANSINPLYPSALHLDEKISCCERIYEGRGLPIVFKLTDAAQPDGLDAALARRGYVEEARTSVQTLSLLDIDPQPQDPDVIKPTFSTYLSTVWLSDYGRLNNVSEKTQPVVRHILNKIMVESIYLTLCDDKSALAAGMAVLERDYVGLQNIVVHARRRKQGLGTQLMAHLLAWAKAKGAHTAYLSVMLANATALKLYERLGFKAQYEYWYRVKR
jgi:N-acetylglutamate synthase